MKKRWIGLFGISFCLFEIWIKSWMQSLTIIGIESDKLMFHVLYIERSDTWKIEICGLRNFTYEDCYPVNDKSAR